MIAVVCEVIPATPIAIDEIAAMQTKSYYIFFSDSLERYVVVSKRGSEFDVTPVPKNLETLTQIDVWMFEEFGEHIMGVSRHSEFCINFIE